MTSQDPFIYSSLVGKTVKGSGFRIICAWGGGGGAVSYNIKYYTFINAANLVLIYVLQFIEYGKGIFNSNCI